MSTDLLNLNLRVWRQAGPKDKGSFQNLSSQRRQHAHVVPRNARCAE